MAILAAFSLGSVLSLLWVALGLGLVIFFHELGHFAVAKWCDVHVERFSIGFGPIIFSRKWGETEYALSAVPFGGYVKMLGQDDVDPSQLTSDEIAEDPRSYSAKNVPQRMAIISAGVIMNVITGVGFFAIAFGIGREMPPPVVGAVRTGEPAWQAGIERGDVITRINGRDVETFEDIYRGVALSSQSISISGVHRNGSKYSKTIQPDMSGTRPVIGVQPTLGTRLIDPRDSDMEPVVDGTAAARATPPFQPGDLIVKVGDEEITSFAHLQDILAVRAAEAVTFTVQRKGGERAELAVEPNHYRTLGLWMDSGQIAAIREDSPAQQQGLQVGDKIVQVNGLHIGVDIDPLRLPDYFTEHHDEKVRVVVTRQIPGGPTKDVEMTLTPKNLPGGLERPAEEGEPLAIPAIGAAYHVIPVVRKVEPGSPAAAKNIQLNASVKGIELVLPDNVEQDMFADRRIKIDLDEENANNWAYAFWVMQRAPLRTVALTVKEEGELRTVTMTPRDDENWHLPMRGIIPELLMEEQQADGVAGALQMGLAHTRNTGLDIYLTLRNLLTGLLSFKELHGPIGIAVVAYDVAQRGMAPLLIFLGFLSVNLAVLNFLPIPVLDGGHMVFLIWEGVTRRRPSEKVLVAATYVGMAFVLGLMLLVIYLDLFVHRLGVN